MPLDMVDTPDGTPQTARQSVPRTFVERQALARYVLLKYVRPALATLAAGAGALPGRGAEQLVLGTGIQESALTYRLQIGGGPGRGLWQMEPATLEDVWCNYLRYRRPLRDRLLTLLPADLQPPRPDVCPPAEALVRSDLFAAAMCRVHYLRARGQLPAAGDLDAQAAYWKRHYNTALGAGRPEQYIANWGRWIGPHTFDPEQE